MISPTPPCAEHISLVVRQRMRGIFLHIFYIKKDLFKGLFSRAPRVGFEPTTLKLHVTLMFPLGMDYLIFL